MSKKNLLIACFVIAAMFFCVVSVSAQQVPKASSAVTNALKGMNIVVGNWWSDYNPDTYKPRSDYEERQLDYRKRLTQQYGFKMQNKNVASWNEMASMAATSIMAGRPSATVFVLQPDWALALYRQNLLYPISTNKAIKFTDVKPVEWNRSVNSAFTFGGRQFAFADGYGGSQHAAVVFFNKRLFREAGLDPNLPYDMQKSGEWTWAKFLEVARKLTRDINNDGITDIYAMPGDLSTEILDALVSSNGAMYVDKDPRTGMLKNVSNTPAFMEAVSEYMKWRDAGIMKPKPVGPDGTTGSTPWNWHIPEFNDGRVAMRFDQQYLATNDLRNMKDEWGMVLPPKGPRSRNYVVFNDENVMVIPAKGFNAAQVDAILWAVQSWVTPVDENWRLAEYPNYRDRRAVDETMALIRDQKLWQWKFHLHVPGLNRGGIAWEIWFHDGQPAQLIEAVRQSWDNLIMDANGL